MQQDITRTADEISMYRAGLGAGMAAYARGDMDHEAPMVSPSALVQAYGLGYHDADDDSDEPRPDDAAALQAMAREVFAELSRIGAKVSAWPDYERGHMRLDDGLTDEAHDPETLLATLRGLPAGAGLAAMWDATAAVAASSLDWRALAVSSEDGDLLI